MLILKVKQAQCALAGDRLDEAFALLLDAEVRSHRDAQPLVTALVAALVGRGQAHLSAGRLGEASGDCEKAGRLGGNSSDVAQLRQAVAQALLARQQAQHAQGQLLAAARRCADDGRLSVGEQMLAQAEDDNSQAAALREEIQARRGAAQAAIARATACLEKADFDGAIEAASLARRSCAGGQGVPELVAQVAASASQQARQMLEIGRMDRAESLLARLDNLVDPTAAVQELHQALELSHRAAGLLGGGEPRQASLVLRQLQSILPEAKWLSTAIEKSMQAAEAMESLGGGPLGLLFAGDGAGNAKAMLDPNRGKMPLGHMGETPMPHDGVPRKLFLHVDGVGSYLILRGHRVTVGPISSSPAPDLGLVAEPNRPAWTIERTEEDYFLRSQSPVPVNGKATTSKLLADGDEIELSPRCKVRFCLPVAASTTAVLKLSGPALPGSHCRQVILLDGNLILGPGTSSHVRVEALAEPAVLYGRNGGLWLRATMASSPGGAAATPVKVGQPVALGPVRLVLAEK